MSAAMWLVKELRVLIYFVAVGLRPARSTLSKHRSVSEFGDEEAEVDGAGQCASRPAAAVRRH